MLLTNWFNTFEISISRTQYVEPKAEEELALIVKNKHRYPSPLIPLGSKHSPVPFFDQKEGTFVSMKNFKKMEMDKEKNTATFGAGVHFIDASEFLLKQKKQFLVHYEIGTATMGSLACCHMKDSSYNNYPYYHGGIFSKYCVRIKFVDSSGEIKIWMKESEKENFEYLTSSHGLFGFIVEATYMIEDLSLCQVTHHIIT